MEEEKTIVYGNLENEKIKFSTKNISIIGSNGSGKSSLMRKIKQLNPNFTIISAHKNLTIKQGSFRANDDIWLVQHKSLFESPITGGQLQPSDNNYVQNDFNQILEIIFRGYTHETVEAFNAGKGRKDISRSLDKIFDVWNSIFIDKKLLYTDDKVRVQVVGEDNFYDIENLSDGERISLYILIKVLLSDSNSTIVIDEPETFLNPSILNSLFDECEKMKNDCNFLYLSHDLEFVTTRKNNSIFWIKEFKYSDIWNIVDINPQEIPEELIVKVVGAKKQKILFVESDRNKDSQLYQLIYPDFKVWPVGSCENVISYTKAFNTRTEKFNKLYFGLIDKDLRSEEQITELASQKIFTIPFAIYENIFYCEPIVKFIFEYLGRNDFDIKFLSLKNEIIRNVSDINFKDSYKQSKVQNLFNTNLVAITKDEFKFIPNIEELDTELKLLSTKSYEEILAVLNQKSIKGCVSKLGFEWETWQTQILNTFNTDKSESFRSEFLKFMPNIK